jgi:hypothetical protein
MRGRTIMKKLFLAMIIGASPLLLQAQIASFGQPVDLKIGFGPGEYFPLNYSTSPWSKKVLLDYLDAYLKPFVDGSMANGEVTMADGRPLPNRIGFGTSFLFIPPVQKPREFFMRFMGGRALHVSIDPRITAGTDPRSIFELLQGNNSQFLPAYTTPSFGGSSGGFGDAASPGSNSSGGIFNSASDFINNYGGQATIYGELGHNTYSPDGLIPYATATLITAIDPKTGNVTKKVHIDGILFFINPYDNLPKIIRDPWAVFQYAFAFTDSAAGRPPKVRFYVRGADGVVREIPDIDTWLALGKVTSRNPSGFWEPGRVLGAPTFAPLRPRPLQFFTPQSAPRQAQPNFKAAHPAPVFQSPEGAVLKNGKLPPGYRWEQVGARLGDRAPIYQPVPVSDPNIIKEKSPR